MGRGRTLLLYPLPAVLVAASWGALEDPRQSGKVVVVVLLALVPAVVGPLVARAGAGVVATLAAAAIAFSVSPLVRPDRFFGPVLGRLRDGVLAFYDVMVPFAPAAHPRMHAVLVAAVFVFCLALSLFIAAGRPLFAGLVTVAGTAWPATLTSATNELKTGGFLLAALLLLAAGLGRRASVPLRSAVIAGGLIIAAALGASASPSIAKGAFLDWEHWRLGGSHARVSVAYVWNSNYAGLTFPHHATTVLRVEAPSRRRYWRATTLDSFSGRGWIEALRFSTEPSRFRGRTDFVVAPTSPTSARRAANWERQRVDVLALADDHLVGGEIPVAYGGPLAGHARYDTGGVAWVPNGLDRGDRYDVWSSATDPTLRKLRASAPRYPKPIAERELLVGERRLPAFGTPNRQARLDAIFAGDRAAAPYRPLYEAARRVAGRARTPYEATAAIESWLRLGGRFRYDQHPPATPGSPPLVAFVTRTRAGYCQHFAGAMALMLRFLGIPARVAAGFTSGSYDRKTRTWTVTDHDAHTWVEVWFDGLGWVPFDPTPGRGTLPGSYTAASPRFDASGAAVPLVGLLGLSSGALKSRLERAARQGLARGARVGVPSASSKGGARSVVRRRGPGLLALVALVLLGLAAAIAFGKTAVRRVRYATRDPRRTAAACRRELTEFLADQGVSVEASAAPGDLASLVGRKFGVDGAAFARALAAARYGPPASALAEAGTARRELRRLRRALRRRLGVRDRAVGLVSLRSLTG